MSLSTTARELAGALLSAAHPRIWSRFHEQTLRRFLSPSRPLTPSLLSSTLDPHLLPHRNLALGLFRWASQQPSFAHTPLTFHSLLKSIGERPRAVRGVVWEAKRLKVELLPESVLMVVECLVRCGCVVDAKDVFWQVPISRFDGSSERSFGYSSVDEVFDGMLSRDERGVGNRNGFGGVVFPGDGVLGRRSWGLGKSIACDSDGGALERFYEMLRRNERSVGGKNGIQQVSTPDCGVMRMESCDSILSSRRESGGREEFDGVPNRNSFGHVVNSKNQFGQPPFSSHGDLAKGSRVSIIARLSDDGYHDCSIDGSNCHPKQTMKAILSYGALVGKTCNSLLAGLSDGGYWVHAKEVYDEMMPRNVDFNDVGFGVFVGGYCRFVELDEVLAIVEAVKQQIPKINGSIIALLVVDGLCRVGRFENAWWALEELRIRDCKPDFIAYRVVSEAFKSNGRLDDATMLLKQKRKLGVAPRINDYKNFIFNLISERRTQAAAELGKAIVDGDFPIDDDLLNALISSVSLINPAIAIFFCKYMINNERFPSFSTLTNFSRNLYKCEKTEEMWEIYKILMSKGYFTNMEGYNLMVSFLCEAGKVREAYDVFKEMRQNGLHPNVSLYNTLMAACCREDYLRPAKRLWDEMFANNCNANLETYNIMIQKFCEINDVEEACRLFHHMLEKRVVPDSATYSSVVKALCHENRIDDARNIFNKSVEQDAVLAGSVLVTLTIGFCEGGNFVAASKLLQCAPLKIDMTNSHVILLRSLSDTAHIDEAIEHVNWIRDNCPSHVPSVMNELIASLSTAPNMEHMLQLLRALFKHGLISEFGPWLDM